MALYVGYRLCLDFSVLIPTYFLTTLRSHLDVACSCYFWYRLRMNVVYSYSCSFFIRKDRASRFLRFLVVIVSSRHWNPNHTIVSSFMFVFSILKIKFNLEVLFLHSDPKKHIKLELLGHDV